MNTAVPREKHIDNGIKGKLEERTSVVTDSEKPNTAVASKSLLAVVKSKGSDGKQWKEVADIMSYSAGGAAFFIEKECRVGCLVSMMFAMPAHLRCYDHEKDLYRVWGLVQFCQQLKHEGREGFHVGVAFAGKQAPQSYRDNPEQGYRIRGMDADGFWRIDEAKSPYQIRRQIRYWAEVRLYLALLDGKRDTIGGERTVTENISKSGAAVFSTLDIGVGDRVKFISEQFDFSGLAVICNKTPVKGSTSRLNLQFVENQFPVERLKVLKKK